MGDFNYPNITWTALSCNKEDEQFVDLIQDNFLFQHVAAPTRESNIGLLDLVISNSLQCSCHLRTVIWLGDMDSPEG